MTDVLTRTATSFEAVDIVRIDLVTTDKAVEFLQRRRAVTIADLDCKKDAEDWHGVADAAMDLREIDAKLSVLRG